VRTPIALVVAASALAALAAPAARAADTATTFDLTAGGLSVSAPASGALGSAAAGSAVLSGALGTVTVTDARGLLAGTWTVTATATDFTTGDAGPAETITSDRVTYLAPLPTIDAGTVVPASTGPQVLDQARDVVTAVGVVGSNQVSWNPLVSITLPAQAVAGTYAGTITHSVA
jgi:hypothetical protein